MTTSTVNVIQVRIGTQTITYAIGVTNAPASYDGFGTFTIASYDGELLGKPCELRNVLIAEEHLHWQTMRYRSGLYVVVTDPDNQFGVYIPDLTEVQPELWKALAAGYHAREASAGARSNPEANPHLWEVWKAFNE